MSYTYFIQAEVGGPIKIGKADDIPSRLKLLQCGNPEKLVVVGYICGDVERSLHRRFRKYRIRGEWFLPSPAVLAFLEKNVKGSAPRGLVAPRRQGESEMFKTLLEHLRYRHKATLIQKRRQHLARLAVDIEMLNAAVERICDRPIVITECNAEPNCECEKCLAGRTAGHLAGLPILAFMASKKTGEMIVVLECPPYRAGQERIAEALSNAARVLDDLTIPLRAVLVHEDWTHDELDSYTVLDGDWEVSFRPLSPSPERTTHAGL